MRALFALALLLASCVDDPTAGELLAVGIDDDATITVYGAGAWRGQVLAGLARGLGKIDESTPWEAMCLPGDTSSEAHCGLFVQGDRDDPAPLVYGLFIDDDEEG